MWRPFTAGHTSSSTSGFRLGRSLTCAVSMEGPSPIAALSFYIKGPTLEKNPIRAKNLGKPSAVSQPSLDSLASTLKRSPVSAMNEGRPSAAGHTSWGTRGSTVEEALWVQESLLQESRPHSTVHHPHWGEALWTQSKKKKKSYLNNENNLMIISQPGKYSLFPTEIITTSEGVFRWRTF